MPDQWMENPVVFWYVYKPLACSSGPKDGGFSIGVYQDGTLLYTTFDQQQQRTASMRFGLPMQTVAQLNEMVAAHAWWLGCERVDLAIPGAGAGYSAMIGFGTGASFQVTDMEQMLGGGFRDWRYRLVRRLYLALEDTADILEQASFRLSPNRFIWNSAYVNVLSSDLSVAV